jgi:hypothetical protein
MLALHLLLSHFHTYYRPPLTPLDIVANVELGIGCVLIVLFTVFYGIRFRWYATPPTLGYPRGRTNLAGIAIFSIFAAMSMLLLLSVITRLLTPGDYLFRDLFRVIVYFFLPASGVMMFVALFRSREELLRELQAARQTRQPEAPAPATSDSEA